MQPDVVVREAERGGGGKSRRNMGHKRGSTVHRGHSFLTYGKKICKQHVKGAVYMAPERQEDLRGTYAGGAP